MEEAIISNSIQQGKLLETNDKTNKSRLIKKLELTQLEKEITQKDAIINFLTNKLLQIQCRKFHIDLKSMTHNNKTLKVKIMFNTTSIKRKI